MSIRALPFPMLDGTTAAIITVAYVLAQVGPFVKNQRDLQRMWKDCGTAAKDGLHKFERLQGSMTQAKDAVAALSALEPDTAVQNIRRMRGHLVRFLDDFDLALLAFETLDQKFSALHRRYGSKLAKVVPGYEQSARRLPKLAAEAAQLRGKADSFRDARVVEQCDEMIALAVEAATAAAIAQSHQILAAGRPLSGEDALAALRKVHEFARTHGVKLSA